MQRTSVESVVVTPESDNRNLSLCIRIDINQLTCTTSLRGQEDIVVTRLSRTPLNDVVRLDHINQAIVDACAGMGVLIDNRISDPELWERQGSSVWYRYLGSFSAAHCDAQGDLY